MQRRILWELSFFLLHLLQILYFFMLFQLLWIFWEEQDSLFISVCWHAYDEWERDNQHPDKTAIVMLDLNNLKKCNDRYGHEAGDTYLKKASEMITNAFSQENTVYRIGGDEFCVIMPDAKENSIEGAMDRLKELQKQYKGTDHSVEVEIACGYAFYDDNVDQSFVDTRKRADTHMYENKRMLKGKEPR